MKRSLHPGTFWPRSWPPPLARRRGARPCAPALPLDKTPVAICRGQARILNYRSGIFGMRSRPKYRLPVPLLIVLLVCPLPARGQKLAEPYAAIDRNAVSYAGPGRDAGHDLAGREVRIGFMAPLQGPRQAEGEALLQAAQLAIEDEAANPLPGGRRLALAPRDESGPWGRASSEIARLVFDDQAVALITSADGGAAHLAEQVGNKIGVPVLTLSTDQTTTQINLPWIFRLGSNDAAQARAFAQNIYLDRRLHRVLLITNGDHDGRVGGEAFEKAARELHAPLPHHVVFEPTLANFNSVVDDVQKAEAVALWTGPDAAARLVAHAREVSPFVPIYLCWKAAQGWRESSAEPRCRSCPHAVAKTLRFAASSLLSPLHSDAEDGGVWTVVSSSGKSAAAESFEQQYRERVGTLPSAAAAQAYDAVRIIVAGLRRSGPNRARLRDALAELSNFSGASGSVSFDHAGNNLTPVSLIRLD